MNNIKLIRKELHMSLYDIAKATGLTPSYIANIECGRRTNPSLATMQKISKALNKKVENVFNLNTTIKEKEMS